MNNIPEGYEQFSWDEAVKRPEDVVTRDGRPVKLAGYNAAVDGPYQLVGWLNDYVSAWRITGRLEPCVDNNSDLFLRAKTTTVYRNDYGPNKDILIYWESLEKAIKKAEGRAKNVIAYTYQGDKLIDIKIVHQY